MSTPESVATILKHLSSRPVIWTTAWSRLLIPLFVYAAMVPVTASVHVPLAFRVLVFNRRPFFLGASLVVALLAYAGRFARDGSPAARLARSLLRLALAFPLLFLVLAFWKDALSLPVVGQYFLWAFGAFGLAPLVLTSRSSIGRLGKVFFFISLSQWSAAFLTWTLLGDGGLPFRHRLSFGIANPNFYAQIVQVGVSAFGLWWASSPRPAARPWRVAWAFLIPGAAYLVAAARSRNVVAYLGTLAATYVLLFLLASRRAGWAIVATGSIFVVTMAFFLTVEPADVDAFSSGRITMWQDALAATFQREPLQTVLVGPTSLPSAALWSYDEAAPDKVFLKFHIDNAYLELLLEAGLFGLLLFIAPYARIARFGLARIRSGAEPDRVRIWSLAIFAGVAVQSGLVSTLPTFNSPLGVFFLFAGAAPLFGLESGPRSSVAGRSPSAVRSVLPASP